jgi:hypothetical protein
MNKLGLFLIALNILITIATIAIGFKMKNILFAFIIGFLAVIGLTFMGNIFKLAKDLTAAFETSPNFLYVIKNLFIAFFNSFDIFIIIGQLVFYLLIVMKNPDIFTSTELPKNFKTKNTTAIISFAAQIAMAIGRSIMKLGLFGEITMLIGIITAFLIYDIKTDIEKKKVDKYSYK